MDAQPRHRLRLLPLSDNAHAFEFTAQERNFIPNTEPLALGSGQTFKHVSFGCSKLARTHARVWCDDMGDFFIRCVYSAAVVWDVVSDPSHFSPEADGAELNGVTLAARQSYELRDGADITFAVRNEKGESLTPIKMKIAIDLAASRTESETGSDAGSEKADVKAV